LGPFKVKTLGCHPNWPQGAPIAAPLENPRLFTARSAREVDVFQALPLSTAKCRRLGGAFASDFEPQVSNHSLSAIFDCGFEASQPNRSSGFCFAPPPEKGEAGRGYCSKFRSLNSTGTGFTPSPLRGEGWDEEWFQPHKLSSQQPDQPTNRYINAAVLSASSATAPPAYICASRHSHRNRSTRQAWALAHWVTSNRGR